MHTLCLECSDRGGSEHDLSQFLESFAAYYCSRTLRLNFVVVLFGVLLHRRVGIIHFQRRVVSQSLHGRLVSFLLLGVLALVLQSQNSLHGEFVLEAHHFLLASCPVVGRVDPFLAGADAVYVRRATVLVATEHGSEALRLFAVLALPRGAGRNLTWLFLADSVVVTNVAQVVLLLTLLLGVVIVSHSADQGERVERSGDLVTGRNERQAARLLHLLKLLDPLDNLAREVPVVLVLELLPLQDVDTVGNHFHLGLFVGIEVGPKLAVLEEHLYVVPSCALVVSLLLNDVKRRVDQFLELPLVLCRHLSALRIHFGALA